MNLDILLDCAVETARTAGRYALDNWSRRGEILQSFSHDVKLMLDVETQGKAQAVIRKHFPDHAILAEEDQASHGKEEPSDRVVWVLDPIDGTVNFSHGFPFWCTSVAATIGGRTVAGAIYAPALDQLFVAKQGGPALCNDRVLKVSNVKSLSESIVMTGVDRNGGTCLAPVEFFQALAVRAQKMRVMGVAALDLCQVASGRAEGYFESGIYPWDIAAARLVITQAGGTEEILFSLGENRLCFLATNGLIHDQLKEVIAPLISRLQQSTRKA